MLEQIVDYIAETLRQIEEKRIIQSDIKYQAGRYAHGWYFDIMAQRPLNEIDIKNNEWEAEWGLRHENQPLEDYYRYPNGEPIAVYEEIKKVLIERAEEFNKTSRVGKISIKPFERASRRRQRDDERAFNYLDGVING